MESIREKLLELRQEYLKANMLPPTACLINKSDFKLLKSELPDFVRKNKIVYVQGFKLKNRPKVFGMELIEAPHINEPQIITIFNHG